MLHQIKTKEEMTRKEDQIELSKIKCVLCDEMSSGIIRTKEVCNKHYSIYRRDNILRFNLVLDIPADFSRLTDTSVT